MNGDRYLRSLDLAELQFKLGIHASTAANIGTMPQNCKGFLWGGLSVDTEYLTLNSDELPISGAVLQHSVTYLLAVAVDTALEECFEDRFNSAESNVVCAARIARIIRNAFAHDPFFPTWIIDKESLRKVYSIKDVIELDATNLHGQAVKREQYGGPLALLRFLHHAHALIEHSLGAKQNCKVDVAGEA
jgi:hypothetical protein